MALRRYDINTIYMALEKALGPNNGVNADKWRVELLWGTGVGQARRYYGVATVVGQANPAQSFKIDVNNLGQATYTAIGTGSATVHAAVTALVTQETTDAPTETGAQSALV